MVRLVDAMLGGVSSTSLRIKEITLEAKQEHPAKFTPGVLAKIAPHLPAHKEAVILDPFAGIGGVFALHKLGFRGRIIGIEIEPEWAAAHPGVKVGNALQLPFPDAYFDAIVTSPVYGNRMSDHHRAKDSSRRITYTHVLGRELHPDNAGKLQWGAAYRDFHARAWREAVRVLKPGGLFFLNIKDHVRKRERQHVSLWHMGELMGLGLVSKATDRILVNGNRYGENREARIPYEFVYRMEKPSVVPHERDQEVGLVAAP